MRKRDLLKLVEELPDDTEFQVRWGSQCCPATVTLQKDVNGKITAYITSFADELRDHLGEHAALDGLLQELVKPYPKEGLPVCVHGKPILGYCGSCISS